jgi:hypothetical protein
MAWFGPGRGDENSAPQVTTMKDTSGQCEMCGHDVKIRQQAHIVAKAGTGDETMLKLCPSCHLMFDHLLKPRLYTALRRAGAKSLPACWKTSLYEQAATASLAAGRRAGPTRAKAVLPIAKAGNNGWDDPVVRANRIAGIRAAKRLSKPPRG